MFINNLKKLFSNKSAASDLKQQWDENGFVILKNFFDKPKLDAYNREVERLIANRTLMGGEITIDVLEGDLIGKRMKIKDAPDQAFESAHKINDLYLESEACRELNLSRELTDVLSELLEGEPLIINSLTFKKGSQQPHHFDTYYMPPPKENGMIVSSICLEDQSFETGPLSYYPGSHKVPAYKFSHGGINAINEEMPDATKYIDQEIEKRNLRREEFIGKAGDVFLWHAQLYHGGLPILDHQKTRKTLVTHYWRASDVEPERVVKIKGSGSYLKREHQKT